jgi:pimeloyl-ACP methyl ester carboxylesterase
MSPKHRKLFDVLVLVAVCIVGSACSTVAKTDGPEPLIIKEQGSFATGGSVISASGTYDAKKQTSDGQTFHGDHAYVFYQVPVNARKFPLVLLHGFGQFSKTWETTPDGREGYQNIFLRRGFAVYLIDQPRRGNAGRSTEPLSLTPTPDEQTWFNIFRVGIWPEYFPGAQFSRDPEALNQYFRQMTPNTGPFDAEVISGAVSALFNRIGPGFSSPTHRVAGRGGSPPSRIEMSALWWPMSLAAVSSFRMARCRSRCRAPAAPSRRPACPWRSSCF